MEYPQTSTFTRCIQCLFRKKPSLSRASPSISTSSWPWKTNSHSDDSYDFENDVALLLEERQYSVTRVLQDQSTFSNFSTASTRRRDTLKRPPWCRLPSSTRFTVLLITLFLLVTVSHAAPLQHERQLHLHKKQSVPDRFGNTGNRPAPVAPPASASRITTSTTTSPRTNSQSPTASVETLSTSITQMASPTSTTSNNGIPTTGAEPFPIPIGPTSIPSSTLSTIISPTGSTTGNQLQRVEPQNELSPAAIAGISLSCVIFVAFVIGTLFILHRRKKAREIREIAVRRSKLGNTLAGRVFGNHYDDNIARSRSKRVKKSRFVADDTVASWGNLAQELPQPTPPNIYVEKPPISPSVYSPRPLTRATRLSAMTFGTVSGWLEKSSVGRPQPAVFTGTPSQLLDAPRPLFSKQEKRSNDGIRGDISPPRPLRPGSAEPLGRLSGMGFGLGMR